MAREENPNRIPTSETRFTEDMYPGEGLDEGEEFASLEDIKKDDTPTEDNVVEATGDDDTTEPAATGDDDVPPELRGKSPAELARMYREAQSLIGRQGRELGESRKLLDTYVKQQIEERNAQKQAEAAAKGTVEETKVDAIDYYTDPEKAVERAIANHPVLKRLEGEARELAAREIVRTQQANKAEFDRLHPDVPQIMADPQFRKWVDASPVRRNLLLRAHKQYDLTAGNEIFSLWKEIKGIKPGTANASVAAAQRKSDKSAAKVPGGGGRPAAKSGKKFFKRAEIIEKMSNDPAWYEAHADEIALAYAEKRVR